MKNINTLLKDYPQDAVAIYVAHIKELYDVFDKKDNKYKNRYWMDQRTDEYFAEQFIKVSKQGLEFDGKNIILQSTGISYNWVAFKNKMLFAYPDTKIDGPSLVYKGDEFSFKKENGHVIYTHTMSNPFDRKDENIIGGYVIIKNGRGEFITLLSQADFVKHKAAAKTQSIWNSWYPEMCKKTIMKKGCSEHYRDEFEGILEADNEEYQPQITTPEQRNFIEEINAIESVDQLRDYYKKNEGLGKEFTAEIVRRKTELNQK